MKCGGPESGPLSPGAHTIHYSPSQLQRKNANLDSLGPEVLPAARASPKPKPGSSKGEVLNTPAKASSKTSSVSPPASASAEAPITPTELESEILPGELDDSSSPELLKCQARLCLD